MEESIVVLLRVDAFQAFPEVIQGGFRIRFFQHEPVEELLFPVRPLEKAAACMDDAALQEALHARIAGGASYAAAMAAEVAARTGVAAEVLRAPNNILGMEYLRAVRRFAPEMETLLVQRVGTDYHDTDMHGRFASASAIRAALEGIYGEIPSTAQSSLSNVLPSPLLQSASLTAPSEREP